MASEKDNMGTVTYIRGSVVDVLFPRKLPPLYDELRAGDDEDIVIEPRCFNAGCREKY
jgi:F0F1-type ATP synthase beta subunit